MVQVGPVGQGCQTIPEELQGHGRNWSCPGLVSGLSGCVQMPLRKSRLGAELELRAVQRASTVETSGQACCARTGRGSRAQAPQH